MTQTTAAGARTGYTQGPWRVEKPDQQQSPNIWIFASSNPGIAKIEPCDYDDGKGERLTEEDFANAKLIASAPELLASLKLALPYVEWRASTAPTNASGMQKRAKAERDLAAIRAALAKTGGA